LAGYPLQQERELCTCHPQGKVLSVGELESLMTYCQTTAKKFEKTLVLRVGSKKVHCWC